MEHYKNGKIQLNFQQRKKMALTCSFNTLFTLQAAVIPEELSLFESLRLTCLAGQVMFQVS